MTQPAKGHIPFAGHRTVAERETMLLRLHTEACRLEADGLCAHHIDQRIAELEISKRGLA